MTDSPAIIRERSQPLQPQTTDAEPRLDPLSGIEAVVFDVYGTLIISGCGDISLVQSEAGAGTFATALAELGVELRADHTTADRLFRQTVADQQQATGHEFAEVDIVAVWRDFVRRLAEQGAVGPLPVDSAPADLDCERLAVIYEMLVNPVWPMPGCVEVCDALARAGLHLGIVSNAQCFTPHLFTGLCGRSLAELGFHPELCIWSYQHLQAKPGTFLYEQLVGRLANLGVAPEAVLYVGNDMRNDVMPAAKVGFRTALFAGDARSLRLRQDDPLVAGVEPDRVVTDLRQIIDILHLADA